MKRVKKIKYRLVSITFFNKMVIYQIQRRKWFCWYDTDLIFDNEITALEALNSLPIEIKVIKQTEIFTEDNLGVW